MRRVILITLFVVGLMVMIHVEALSKQVSDLPLLIDLSQLELKVTDVKVVGHISETILGEYNETTLSAKKGDKLVVVSLEGRVQKPCRLVFDPSGFAVVYKEKIKVRIKKADAIAKKGLPWAILLKGVTFTKTYYIYNPGPIILKVAFVISEEVTGFDVLYPALVQGKAAISPGRGEREIKEK